MLEWFLARFTRKLQEKSAGEKQGDVIELEHVSNMLQVAFSFFIPNDRLRKVGFMLKYRHGLVHV